MAQPKGMGSPIRPPDENTNRKKITPETTGVNHSRLPDDPYAEYIRAGSEKAVLHGNCGIVFGTDRTGLKEVITINKGKAAGKKVAMDSGYGAKGHDGTYMIDLCAGRSPYFNIDKVDGKPIAVSAPNFSADAARIYICQKTDPDKNFGLTSGRVGAPLGRSAVVIKADGVRIIGREGVKIVTGAGRGDARKNSKGGPLGSIKGIDLIAGNLSEENAGLQPIPKGLNLVQCLAEMLDSQKFLIHVLKKVIDNIQDINQDFYGHFHNSPFFGAPTNTAPNLLPAQVMHKASLEKSKAELQFVGMNLDTTSLSFLSAASKTYICSTWNNTN
jgi:hypothetical protein